MLSFLNLDFLKGLVQIAILAVLFYYILYYLRGTRSAQMLMGLGALILTLFGLAKIFELKVLLLILGAGSAFMAIGIVVIFQPEIRRALALIGGRTFIGAPVTKADNAAKLVEVATLLARRKIGALIAIEGEVSLKQYADSGINLDAPFEPKLLASIFFPHAPLHDGGVIIRGERIKAASCVFPLAQRRDLIDLGTRHRAAVGLSDETDAVVIVISEETGRVALAHAGRLYRGLSEQKLMRYLRALLPERKRKNILFQQIIDDMEQEDSEENGAQSTRKEDGHA